MFKPGEVTENDHLKLVPRVSSSPNARALVPLSKNIENICRNARATGMRTLVALVGDDSGDAARTIDQLFDYDDDRMRAVLSYLTLRVDTTELKREDAAINNPGWLGPAGLWGEIVLAALDGDQTMIATQRIATNPVAAAGHRCRFSLNRQKRRFRHAI